MIDRAAISIDTRVIATALAANVAVGRPHTITATGRAAPSRYATVPPGAWVPFALLPHIDYTDDPYRRPGCGFVGGRISAIATTLSPSAIPGDAAISVKLSSLPGSSDAILRDLRCRSGLWSAPGALFARVAWNDAMVVAFLDRWRENGDSAQLFNAHAQASLAVRKMWLGIEWGAGVTPGTDLVMSAGAAVVGRALIDVVALVDRLAAPQRDGLAVPAHRETALAALLTALNHYLRHIRAAVGEPDLEIVKRKLDRAVAWASKILDATGVFVVSVDAERTRWTRLTNMLDIGELRDHAGGAATKLDHLSRELEALPCADVGARLEKVGWRRHIRRALIRLSLRDRHLRLSLLARIRSDLIFELAMTRRLDRLYRLFPWAAAPHGAFPGCAGGALGALASLFEAARGIEIGVDMRRRLSDAGQQPGTVTRMALPQAKAIYASPRHVVLAAGRNYAAGNALVAQVTSHVMVRAALDGKRFGNQLSLEATRWGRLAYNDAAALRVAATRDRVIVTYQAQPAFNTRSTDNDLIRYMGLTLIRHFGAVVHSIWPKDEQRTDYVIRRVLVRTGIKPRKKKDGRRDAAGPWDSLSKHGIHRELVRSMLDTVDGGQGAGGQVRDAIEDVAVDQALGREAARAQALSNRPSRRNGAWADADKGQSAARDAANEATNSDPRGQILRDLIDDVRLWRGFDHKKPRPAPQDDLLEDILLGRANLAQLAPVSDLFLPILWFAPLIDRDRLAWIARGMPGQRSGDGDAPHAARLKSWINAVRNWSPAPFASSIVTDRDDVIACHLFTGVSSVTSDLGHVR